MTNEQKIIDSIRSRPVAGQRDDCVSSVLGIRPRQQVNQICNRLRDRHVVSRPRMKCGAGSKWKIVTTFAS